MVVCGIDPGLSGAIALIAAEGEPNAATVFDMPVFLLSRAGRNKREIDAYGLARLLAEHYPIGHAFVEQVGARPGQGTSSMFAFGKAVGIVIGILAANGIPTTAVSPHEWKKTLRVPADKDGARARASQLLPAAAHQWGRAKDSGRAEAALIALWGLRSLNLIASGSR